MFIFLKSFAIYSIFNYLPDMRIKILLTILFSFLFTQLACASSEAADLYMEAIEHGNIISVSHDASAKSHNEVTEHQKKLSGFSHCVHSHPQLTLILDDLKIQFSYQTSEFVRQCNESLNTVYHRPPLTPPKA